MKNALRCFEVVLPYAAILLCGFLIWQNMRLREQNNRLATRVQQLSATEAPTIGDVFPHLTGLNANGEKQTLGYSSLVLYYSSTCPHCEATLPAWRKFASSLHRAQVFVLMSVDKSYDKSSFLAMQMPDNTHQLRLEPDELLFNHLRFTPTTVLIDSSGHVVESIAGEMDSSDIERFENTLRNIDNNLQPKEH